MEKDNLIQSILDAKPSRKTTVTSTMRPPILFVLLCALSFPTLWAQDQKTKFDYLTINEGLSSNRVYCIYRDSRDYLWIATEMGLDRFDSDQIKKYKFNKDKPGTISSNTIQSIYEDSNGQLWFGADNGLNLYDWTTDSFKKFSNNPTDTNSLNGNIIKSIIEDNNNNLWVLTDGNCMNRWDPKDESFTRYMLNDNQDTTINTQANMLATDSKGFIWITSYDSGINRLDPETGNCTRFDDPSFDFGVTCIKSIYIDKNDMVWVGTWGNGFYSFDPANNKFEQYGSNGDGSGTKSMLICDIIPADERYLLLAVDQGGINCFDKVSKTFEYIEYDPSTPHGLNNNGIWCLFKDSENILWVGTSGGGVNYFNPKMDKFRHFTNNGFINSLSYNSILCFYEDHEGMIWIGTDGGGVNVYDPNTESFTVYKNDPSDPYSISGNVALCVVEDKDDNIWVGTWDAGLNKFDRKTGRFYNYLPDKNNPFALSSRSMSALGVDHNNLLWVGAIGSGIELFDAERGVIKRFTADPNDPNSIPSTQIRMFYEDEENNMWVGTSEGLCRYDSINTSFIRYNFPDNSLSAFLFDGNDKIWIGSTESGLYHCKLDGSLIKAYTTDDGLTDNSIRGIISDNHNDLWISTSNGLSQLNQDRQTFRNYSRKDGLQANEFHRQTYLKTSKGEIYLGGYNGFNSLYPANLEENNYIPAVYITDFQIFNKSVDIGDPDSQFPAYICATKAIELTWKQSVFSFSFNAINYTYPENNQYAYMMEGFEREWNYTDASRKYVSYTNLDPGTYTFWVKASNNDGKWNEEGVKLLITILPPWWNTKWFKVIMVSVILIILILSYRSRINSLTKQKVLLEKTVAEKTIELQKTNDTLIKHQHLIEEQQKSLITINSELKELNGSKDKFFSIIAHDLRSPLSAFVGATELLSEDLLSMDTNKIKKITGSMKRSAKNIYDLLENLLEWSRLMRGVMKFDPNELNLLNAVETGLEVLKPSINKKQLKAVIKIPKRMMVFADINMLNGIIRNLVSNAIKFTPIGGKITVSAESINNSIIISVGDSGIGIPEDLKNKIFIVSEKTGRPGTEGEPSAGLGLVLCKEFIQKHGGKIWVESEIDKGTTFKFSLPLKNEHSVSLSKISSD